MHLPVIGDLRLKENTRPIERPISQASTPIVNMTLSNSQFVSVNYAVLTLSLPERLQSLMFEPASISVCGPWRLSLTQRETSSSF